MYLYLTKFKKSFDKTKIPVKSKYKMFFHVEELAITVYYVTDDSQRHGVINHSS